MLMCPFAVSHSKSKMSVYRAIAHY
jgi:hypothetical protein